MSPSEFRVLQIPLLRRERSYAQLRQSRILISVDANRWDQKAGLRRDALGFQVIDALEAHETRRRQ
jgi:hypothetical protein